jgi:hypothetical protein
LRSQIYSRALQEFVARHSPERVTEAMNRVIDEIGGEAARLRNSDASGPTDPKELLARLKLRERVEPTESIAAAIAAEREGRLS